MKSRLSSVLCTAALCIGCTVQDWKPAELQLDIHGASLTDTDRIRICVEGYGMREAALGAGRVAFTGLPPDSELQITVDALVSTGQTEDSGETVDLRSGRAGPVCLGPEDVWSTSDWTPCTTEGIDDTGLAASGDCAPCQTPGDRVSNGESSVVLAIRFSD